jgi:hypothetical protein
MESRRGNAVDAVSRLLNIVDVDDDDLTPGD